MPATYLPGLPIPLSTTTVLPSALLPACLPPTYMPTTLALPGSAYLPVPRTLGFPPRVLPSTTTHYWLYPAKTHWILFCHLARVTEHHPCLPVTFAALPHMVLV